MDLRFCVFIRFSRGNSVRFAQTINCDVTCDSAKLLERTAGSLLKSVSGNVKIGDLSEFFEGFSVLDAKMSRVDSRLRSFTDQPKPERVFCSAARWQLNVESRSDSLFALHGDGAVMIVQNSFYDKQSQAGALGVCRSFKTLEFPKQIRQLSFRYSDTAVADAQRNIA
jgi:hypothetical protein